MKISKGIEIIAIATFVSFLIANIPTGSDPGLGGLILLFWPPILGMAGLIIFLIACAITKSRRFRMMIAVIWAIYLVYVGIGLYIDSGWPLVYY